MPAVNNASSPKQRKLNKESKLLTTVPIPEQSAEIQYHLTTGTESVTESVPEVIQPTPEPDEYKLPENRL